MLETISIQDGLSQGFVVSALQDKEGFLWFATANGLNRYDGIDFQIFKNDPYNPFSLADNAIIAMTEAGNYLGVFTLNQGINLYDRRSRLFYQFPQTAKLLTVGGSRLMAEGDHTLWFFANNSDQHQNLYRFSWPVDLPEQVRRGANPAEIVTIDTVWKQAIFRALTTGGVQPKLWVLGDKNLLLKDLASTTPIQAFDLPEALWNSQEIMADANGGAWVLGARQLGFFDGKTWRFWSIQFHETHFLGWNEASSELWLRDGPDVYAFQLKQAPPTLDAQHAIHHLSVPDIALCAMRDGFDNIWIGTDAKGIRKFNPRSTVFKNYLLGYSIYSPPVTDRQGNVWLSDVRRGKAFSGLLDKKTGQFKTMQEMGFSPQPSFKRLVTDDAGDFWIGSMDESNAPPVLTRFNPVTNQKQLFKTPEKFTRQVFAMHAGANKQIWFANAFQLLRFDIPTQQFSLFEYTIPLDINQGAYALEQTSDGVWWIATGNGLLRAAPKQGSSETATEFNFTLFKNDRNSRNSLPDNQIKSLLIDPLNPQILWIGTGNRGMCRFDTKTNAVTHYNTQNGLSDDTVYGILSSGVDSTYNLWLSTNKGLTRFTPSTGRFQYYFKANGVQDNEFNTYASAKSFTGELLFGGVNGLTIFNPADLSSVKGMPQVYITGLKINNHDIDPRDSSGLLQAGIEFTESIRLSYAQNNLVLQFAATDYTQQERNRFAYYLEGAEPAWVHQGFEHSAQYLHLAPGSYTFWVKSTNSDGVWNEEARALKITILPPWYLSWWAYGLYFLLTAGAVYAFYRLQLKRKLEQLETLRLKELDAFKSRFFTNISHEFRTPLTVILGITEQLMDKPGQTKERLPLIHRNGENLLRLVNQILDLSKLESNTLRMEYVQGDVLAFIRYVVESLHSLANAQNVLLEVSSSSNSIVMDHDPERLQQIVYNLLSNAIKFTPSGGRVRLRAELIQSEFHLSVSDSGVGIAAEDLPRIFDRFFQANNQQHSSIGGTGIGLSLTYELVKAIGGHITAESTLGKGAVFTVILPVTQQAPLVETAGGARYNLPANGLAEPYPALEAGSQASPESPLVLLIEDNPDVLEYLRDCLAPYYRLDFAYNGRAGIEKALEIIPDLIISDVMMPEKDGFEVCETVKNDERSSHIPFVLLTAKASVKDRIAGLRRGADAYLSKPFHPEELLVTLSKLIALRQTLRARYTTLEPLPEPADKDTALEDAFLQKIRSVVENNLENANLSVEDICRAVGMSHSVIHRKLTALTGRSLTLFVRSIRLQKARALLANPAASISEVAYATGFNDPKFFSRVFAEEYGSSPSVFRQQIS